MTDDYYARKSRRDKILACLTAARDQGTNQGWVPESMVISPLIGGPEGTRRVRELTQMGHPIASRPRPGTSTAEGEYRLVGKDQTGIGPSGGIVSREQWEAEVRCQKCGGRQATASMEDDLTNRTWKLCEKCALGLSKMKGIRRTYA